MAKSDSQQYFYREIICDPDTLHMFKYYDQDPHEIERQYKIEDCKEKLSGLINAFILQHATPVQYETFDCIYNRGLTQTESAEVRGVNQTCIHKALYGNIDYQKDIPRRYGGLFIKIRKHCETDPICKKTIEELNRLYKDY